MKHIIVTGHYDCGGVRAALSGDQRGVVDRWIDGIRDTCAQHRDELDPLTGAARVNRLCELNVMRKVEQLCGSEAVLAALAERARSQRVRLDLQPERRTIAGSACEPQRAVRRGRFRPLSRKRSPSKTEGCCAMPPLL